MGFVLRRALDAEPLGAPARLGLRAMRAAPRPSEITRACTGPWQVRAELAALVPALPTTAPVAFTREADLAAPVAEWMKSRHPSATIAEELDFRWGAPDLMAANPSRIDERLASGVGPVLDARRTTVLRAATHGPLDRQQLLAMTSLRWAEYRLRVLTPLMDAGLLAHDKHTDHWAATAQLIEPFSCVTAVELKLTDWRKAVAQAARYRAFANEAWVAMPVTKVAHPLLAAAARTGVGVLGVSPEGAVDHLAAATGPAHDPALRQLAGERLLSVYLGEPRVRRAGSPRGMTEPTAPRS